MGRRPNALVSEYFNRGAKCSDTSNRYSHTCKGCGEHFPKGRVDSLMSHLLRRCPKTTQVERNLIYRAIQQQNPMPPDQADVFTQYPSQAAASDNSGLQSELPPPIQYHHQQQQQSALDTLAEVSRQQLDVASHERSGQNAQPEQNVPESVPQDAEEQFYAQLRDAVRARPDTPAAENVLAEQQMDDGLDASLEGNAPVPLVQTASAANEQFQQTLSGQENLDPALNCSDITMQDRLESHTQQSDDEHAHPIAADGRTIEDRLLDSNSAPINSHPETLSWIPTTGIVGAHTSTHNLADVMAAAKQPLSFPPTFEPATAHAPAENLSNAMAASRQPMPGFGPLRTSAKGRSKFTDNRRKEVQEIRKRGACIRCRMLKKPCSEGTPCNTCKTVGSARLWKGACLRTRLADEFTLWSAGTFNSKSKAAIDKLFESLEKISVDASLEIRLLPNSDVSFTLPAKRYTKHSPERYRPTLNAYNGADPDSALRAQFNTQAESWPIYLIEEDASVLTKLEEYTNQIIDQIIEDETSPFMKPTLQLARKMIKEENHNLPTTANRPLASKTSTLSSPPPPTASPVRSCYTFQTPLLPNVVELWASTSLLTKSNPTFTITPHPTSKDAQPPAILPTNTPLLHTQLNAALESRCSSLSKSITNELERRLLQRQQVSRFQTFLAAVILLNCIERMTGLTHTSSEDRNLEEEEPTSERWREGEHFAELLIMLLRMRGLPPRCVSSNEDGLLKVVGVGKERRKSHSDNDGVDDAAAAEWLESMGLSYAELVKIRDGEDPAEEGRVRAWDLRFIVRALLPAADGG